MCWCGEHRGGKGLVREVWYVARGATEVRFDAPDVVRRATRRRVVVRRLVHGKGGRGRRQGCVSIRRKRAIRVGMLHWKMGECTSAEQKCRPVLLDIGQSDCVHVQNERDNSAIIRMADGASMESHKGSRDGIRDWKLEKERKLPKVDIQSASWPNRGKG